MRRAKTADMFKFVRLVVDLKIKDEFYSLVDDIEKRQKENKPVDIDKEGFKLVYSIISMASTEEAEQRIYDFLSGPFEMTPEEVKNLDYIEFMEALKKTIDIKALIDFFASANL